MEIVSIDADELITLNDYPLCDDAAFRRYVRMVRSNEPVPYVPIVEAERLAFTGALRDAYGSFRATHPRSAYVLLDGSHRTTALCLSGLPIPAVIYRSDADIAEARDAVATGLVRESGTLDLTFDENLAELIAHFSRQPYFMTVEEKTERLVREGRLPSER